MLINRVARRLCAAPGLRQVLADRKSGRDAELALIASGRPLVLAALMAEAPLPTLLVVPTEDEARRTARALSAWLGAQTVARFPERRDYPWSEKAPDDAVVAARCRSVERLSALEPCLCVAAAPAFLRSVPPPAEAPETSNTPWYRSCRFAVGDEISPQDLVSTLIAMGYAPAPRADSPGTFYLHGDLLDVHPASMTLAVRLEFFGDELDTIRSLIASSGQVLGKLPEVRISPCREMPLTEDGILRAKQVLWDKAQVDDDIVHDLQRIAEKSTDPDLERYLPVLFGRTVSPLEHIGAEVRLILDEPRAIFDSCLRRMQEIRTAAEKAGVALEGLYLDPRDLNFGGRSCLTLSQIHESPRSSGGSQRARIGDGARGVSGTPRDRSGNGTRGFGLSRSELSCSRPLLSGSETRLIEGIKRALASGPEASVICSIPDHRSRGAFRLTLSDSHIPFVETLEAGPENAGALTDPAAADVSLPRGVVSLTDAALSGSLEVPGASLAIFCFSDVMRGGALGRGRISARGGNGGSTAGVGNVDNTAGDARSTSRSLAQKTELSFPFKPGDYVVHAVHGIAHFAGIVRRASGIGTPAQTPPQVPAQACCGAQAPPEQDYFLLEYAEGDKLFVPLELAGRITRYVGPDGSAPRLTRLHTTDWSRAVSKARRSAEKLGFDLVDLYTRRSTAKGYAFLPDTPEQREMEAAASFELTADQAAALRDIKADMEAPRPMDRLLCGDVGFGKTEVAICASYKCVADSKQVMVLCPTTILAQQHYETFGERLAPFGVRVALISRFVAPRLQKKICADFSAGRVDVLIGTHRLLSQDVIPRDLGLVIVDEEQRFGVRHKEQIKNIREQIDVLSLSATPIPRTMQMALSGVRDMSLIMTPPPGRKPVKVWVGARDQDMISRAIRTELARGGQVYYVSNRVHRMEEALERVKEAAPEARCAVVHGQMSPDRIEETMLAFTEGAVDVLLATTIIENGIDNPHTNTLIIEDAQRLGLSQLYQLKGRVGRGRAQAYAYIMFPPEIPLTPEAIARLDAIFEYHELGSGAKIALKDLEIRGAGSLMGAEQHGNLSSVGFELFMQMLSDAVAQASGEAAPPEAPDVTLNLPADVFFPDDYIRDTGEKVSAYRALAMAEDPGEVAKFERGLLARYGPLPESAQNLVDKARIRLCCRRLGITSVALIGGRITLAGSSDSPELSPARISALKAFGATVFVQSKKISKRYRSTEGLLLPAVLSLLSYLDTEDTKDIDDEA